MQQHTTLTSIRAGAWIARHLLTPEEQDHLRNAAEAKGLRAAGKDDRLRDCEKTELMDAELSERIWQRLKNLVPQTVVVDENGDDIGLPGSESVLHGSWRACGVNPFFRIVRYAGNGVGHFGPHRDGAFERSFGERSLLTINGYLNELQPEHGGCTRFVDGSLGIHKDEQGRFVTPESAVTHCVRPESGAAVVFFHGLMHDGQPLSAGAPPKWLFRTEVMYQRDTREVEAIAPEDVEARRLDVLAESIERTNATVACELNKLTLRLRDRRISAEAARRKAATWLLKLQEDEDMADELQEELSNAHLALLREGEQDATPEATSAVPGAMPNREERIHTCRHCSAVLLKASFLDQPVARMDSALAMHINGACR